jgi:AraC-like DNA-binding protein
MSRAPKAYIDYVANRVMQENQVFPELGELILPDRGMLKIRFPDQQLVVPAWCCIWIPPFTSYVISSYEQASSWYAVQFDSSFCKHPVFSRPAIFSPGTALKEMIRYAMKWKGKETDPYAINFLGCIRQMLPDEMRQSIHTALPFTDEPHLRQAIGIVLDHLDEPPGIEDLAKQLHLSARTLQRLFRDQLQMSYSTYLKTARVIKAVELLTHSQLQVNEIAFAVGYESQQTFSNTFEEMLGVRPGQFRKDRNLKISLL